MRVVVILGVLLVACSGPVQSGEDVRDEATADVVSVDAVDAPPEVSPDITPDTSCPPGNLYCSGACVDIRTSDANCGACGRACAVGVACVAGACGGVDASDAVDAVDVRSDVVEASLCPNPSMVVCNGACVYLQDDPSNCGACNHTCNTSTETCVAGSCTCTAGLTMCPFGPGETICTNTQTDSGNCGRCGMACPAPAMCVAGACTCTPPLTWCGTQCWDTRTDPVHCGSSCAFCTSDICVDGGCV